LYTPPQKDCSMGRKITNLNRIMLKKILVPMYAAGILLLSAASFAQEGKVRIAVSDLIISPAVSNKQQQIVKNSSLIADIENAIRNGRKFELLTRRASHLQAIRNEQTFAKSELAAGDAAQEGELSNAQTLVQVEVLDFNFNRNSSRVPNISNKYRVQDVARVELSVQILDTAKGSVKGSFPVKETSSGGSFIANGVGSPNNDILDAVLKKAAGSIANQLSDTIFPITVIKVSGKKLFINRGNDSGLKNGEKFVIFENGEELIDPQTGESLGSAETEVGEGVVSRINPKFSVVDITKGDPASMATGFILRRPIQISSKSK